MLSNIIKLEYTYNDTLYLANFAKILDFIKRCVLVGVMLHILDETNIELGSGLIMSTIASETLFRHFWFDKIGIMYLVFEITKQYRYFRWEREEEIQYREELRKLGICLRGNSIIKDAYTNKRVSSL